MSCRPGSHRGRHGDGEVPCYWIILATIVVAKGSERFENQEKGACDDASGIQAVL